MKKTLTTLAILASFTAFAQVGINATESEIASDAVFHVKNKTGENKGVVLPSVSLNNDTQILNGSTNSDGLLVWNNNGSLAKGYYYWDGAKWVKVGEAQPVSLNNITGSIRTVTQANPTEWAKPDTFALIHTTGATIDMPDPSLYPNRIFSVNNQSGSGLNYGGSYQPESATTLTGGKAHILMSNGTGWYIIGGSY